MATDRQARVAVVTGASSGIGKAAAKALAANGWRVIAHGRDPGRTATAEAEIRAMVPTARLDFISADLSLMADAARAADEIAGLTDRIDILINNAGGMGKDRVVTAEGNEAIFAGNHLGHFVLTNRLLPLLRAAAAESAPGATRIISTSSDAHGMGAGMNWDDMQGLDRFNPGLAYCTAKLANILFTRALAQRLAGDGIVAHAVHPGVVASNFASHADEGAQARMAKLDAFTPEEGADTLIWAATDEEAGKSTGGFFHQRKPFPTSDIAQDPTAAERLWIESEKIAARVGVAI